jgi:hypothetical protein
MCRRQFTTLARGLLLLTVVFAVPNRALCDDKPQEQQASARVQKRAEALLKVLRAKQWSKAAPLVVTAAGKHDQDTRRRLDIPKEAAAEVIREKVAAWFQHMYESVPPGEVSSVKILGPDEDYATVYYLHEDLDAFSMRLVDDQWYYTLEFEKPPKLSRAKVRRHATAHRDEWIAREKPEEAKLLQRGVVDSIERTKDGWHVTFVTRTGQDQPEGQHDYFLHVDLDEDGNLIKVVRGPDRLS